MGIVCASRVKGNPTGTIVRCWWIFELRIKEMLDGGDNYVLVFTKYVVVLNLT